MKHIRKETGQALVEFALTGAISLALLLFILDGSRILWNYITVSHAARIGARYAIVHGSKSLAPVGPGNDAALVAHVRSAAIGLSPANLTVTPTWTPNNRPGSKVTVLIMYPVRSVTGLFWGNQQLLLSASSTMVIQN